MHGNLRSQTLLLLFLFLLHSPVHFFSKSENSQNDTIRKIRCRIAVDEECRAKRDWRSKIKRVVADSSKRFEREFGIKFELVRIRPWYSDNTQNSLCDLLKSLKRDIPQKNSEVVIGFTGQNLEKENFSGATICYGSYIILRWIRSEDLLKRTLLHEFCHLFGGIDLYQQESIMNHPRAGDGFDEFTSRAILTNKFRRFEPQVFPLTEDKIDEAISHYESRKDLNRNEHEINLMLARLYIAKENYDLAIRECQNALRISPGLSNAYSLLGTAYQKAGKIELATREYERILSSNGESSEVSFNLGIFYLEGELIDEAVDVLQKVVENNPNFAEAHSNLGLAYLRKGEAEPALKECEKAIKINPHLVEAMVNMGGAHILKGNLKDAEAVLRRALILAPDLAQAHNNLGVVYLKRAKYDSAINEFTKALEYDPCCPMAQLNLGRTYKRMESMDRAIAEYKKVLVLKPDLYQAHLLLAEAYLDKHMVAEAFRQCQVAIQVNPAYHTIYEEVQSYLLRKKDYVLAHEFLKKVERR